MRKMLAGANQVYPPTMRARLIVFSIFAYAQCHLHKKILENYVFKGFIFP
jgi:hypothetical protein